MTLPNAIICDLDGVLCDHRHRLHHVQSSGNNLWSGKPMYGDPNKNEPDYEEYYASMGEDKPNHAIYDIICRYAFDTKEDCKILFVTGRPEKYRKNTEEWLNSWIMPFAVGLSDEGDLFMRPDFITCVQDDYNCGILGNPYCQGCPITKADHRPSHIVKAEIYEREIKDKYNVLFVIEDDPKCVAMYRAIGLTVLDCGRS